MLTSRALMVIPTQAPKQPSLAPLRCCNRHSAFALFSDSRRIAVADWRGVIRIHDLNTGKQLDRHSHLSSCSGVQMLAGHRAAIWGDSGEVVVWDVRDGSVVTSAELPLREDESISGMRFSQDGRWVGAWLRRFATSVCVLAEAATGKVLAKSERTAPPNSFAAFHPSGKWAAIATGR